MAAEEQKRIKDEIHGKNISVNFDGTTRLGEAFAIIVRFVDNWKIEQCSIQLQLLAKTAWHRSIVVSVATDLLPARI